MGPGDIFQTLFGRPPAEAQLAAALGQGPGQPGSPQGPQPLAGQNAPPGGPAGPGGSPDPSGGPAAPQQPPQPQAYQSPPDLAQAYLALSQQNQAKQDFWGGLAGVAQGLHPGRVTPGMVKAITGTSEDAGSLFNNYIQLQAWQQQNTRYNDLFNNSDKYAASFGVDPGMFKATIMAAGPQGAGQILGRIAEAQMGLTGTQTDKEYKQSMKTWGQTPDQQDANGTPLPKPTEAAWDQMQRETITTRTTMARDAANDKLNATNSFHIIDPTLSAAEDNIKWLKDHHDALVRAVHTPGLASSLGGAVTATTGLSLPGVDQDALEARSRIDWLKKNLYAERFAGTKNIRSNTEANNLGASASNLDDIKNSEQQILGEIDRLYDNSRRARANLHAAAGQKVPARYRGLADPTYLNPKSILYNGATEEEAAADNGGGGGDGSSNPPPPKIKTYNPKTGMIE